MSSSISSSLTSIAYNSNGQAVHTANDQQVAIRQQLAQASLTGVYGPPYILDVSLAYAVGDEPLSGSPAPQPEDSQPTLQSNIDQLAQSLQSGNLPAAKQAFFSLSRIPEVQSKLQAQQQGTSDDPLAQALNQTGRALQAGNIKTAQQAFASIQQLAAPPGPTTIPVPPKSVTKPLDAIAINTQTLNPTANLIPVGGFEAVNLTA